MRRIIETGEKESSVKVSLSKEFINILQRDTSYCHLFCCTKLLHLLLCYKLKYVRSLVFRVCTSYSRRAVYFQLFKWELVKTVKLNHFCYCENKTFYWRKVVFYFIIGFRKKIGYKKKICIGGMQLQQIRISQESCSDCNCNNLNLRLVCYW